MGKSFRYDDDFSLDSVQRDSKIERYKARRDARTMRAIEKFSALEKQGTDKNPLQSEVS